VCEIILISQHNLLTTTACLELFLKEHIAHQFYVVGGSVIDFRYDALAENGRDVISGVGFTPLLVYFVGNIDIFFFV
jgi:hypothetical protein